MRYFNFCCYYKRKKQAEGNECQYYVILMIHSVIYMIFSCVHALSSHSVIKETLLLISLLLAYVRGIDYTWYYLCPSFLTANYVICCKSLSIHERQTEVNINEIIWIRKAVTYSYIHASFLSRSLNRPWTSVMSQSVSLKQAKTKISSRYSIDVPLEAGRDNNICPYLYKHLLRLTVRKYLPVSIYIPLEAGRDENMCPYLPKHLLKLTEWRKYLFVSTDLWKVRRWVGCLSVA